MLEWLNEAVSAVAGGRRSEYAPVATHENP